VPLGTHALSGAGDCWHGVREGGAIVGRSCSRSVPVWVWWCPLLLRGIGDHRAWVHVHGDGLSLRWALLSSAVHSSAAASQLFPMCKLLRSATGKINLASGSRSGRRSRGRLFIITDGLSRMTWSTPRLYALSQPPARGPCANYNSPVRPPWS
jgi:hypothetical protein